MLPVLAEVDVVLRDADTPRPVVLDLDASPPGDMLSVSQ
jgi:hypothetical protein